MSPLNRLILIGFLLFASGKSLIAQQALSDSLRNLYSLEKDPSKQLELYHSIAKEAIRINLEEGSIYADTLDQLAKKTNTLKAQAISINFRGRIAKEKGSFEEALKLLYMDLSIREKLNDKFGIALSYNDLGSTYADLYKADSAISYYLKAVEIFDQLKEYSNLASAYSNIGSLYSDQKAHEKAISYLQKALKIRLEHGEEKKCMFTYNNLCVAYGSMEGTPENIEKAIEYANKGVAIALKYHNLYVAGVIEGGLCHLLLKKSKYKEAIQYCNASIQKLETAKRSLNLVFPYVNLASVYNKMNQPDSALKYAQKGYVIMEEKHLVDPLEVYYEEFANAYEQKGNHKEALVWFKKFMTLDDSLFKAENVKNLADVETKYQSEKKEKELIVQRETNFKQRTWLIGLAVSIFVILIFSYLFYNRYRLKQNQTLQEAIIKEQKLGLNAVIEAQEAERKRIAKDLHDGIAQELVALKLGFDHLYRKVEHSIPNEAIKLGELSVQLNETCTELRNISHVMMPPTLETKGLVPSLQMLLRNTIEQTGIKTQFEHFDLPDRMDPKTELGLYRITQELLHNILKHARAKNIFLQLYKAGNNLILRIEDDGMGFDFNEAKQKGSMGLLNILSRVNTLEGSYFSERGDQLGTISTIRIPLT
ncbi:MAG: sensor histidine kinase [Saprospiraceae bacterium]